VTSRPWCGLPFVQAGRASASHQNFGCQPATVQSPATAPCTCAVIASQQSMDCESLQTRARAKKAASLILILILQGSLQTHIAFAALQLRWASLFKQEPDHWFSCCCCSGRFRVIILKNYESKFLKTQIISSRAFPSYRKRLIVSLSPAARLAGGEHRAVYESRHGCGGVEYQFRPPWIYTVLL
jgi:hypothetical protein